MLYEPYYEEIDVDKNIMQVLALYEQACSSGSPDNLG